jgi:hypothetical protein
MYVFKGYGLKRRIGYAVFFFPARLHDYKCYFPVGWTAAMLFFNYFFWLLLSILVKSLAS